MLLKAGAPSGFPYRIEAKVGEGSMGAVYRAFDPDLNRRVALKVMREDTGQSREVREEARRRFLQEARAAAALTHPGVATIYQIGEEDGRPFIAMEWLEGETLEAVLERQAPLPVARAARLGVELAEALEAAHASGIVHRDIKPANLMLVGDGRLKVTDFGIARLAGSELVRTQSGDVLATPMYASPEQLLGQPVDGRSDLFSAGIVLYVCLTGKQPFEGRSLGSLATAILQSDPPSPHAFNAAVPPGLAFIVLKLLRKNRDHRFARARDLAEALRPYAEKTTSSAASRTSPLTSPVGDALATHPRLGGAPRPADALGGTHAVTPGPCVTGLPKDPRRAVSTVVTGWPAKDLELRSVPDLINRLLEVPLHADAFSGGVAIGDTALLLLDGGWIVGAVDLRGERSGDEVAEALPPEASVRLHHVPAGLPPGVVSLLASLLLPRRVRHADLDSSFVNLPALAKKLGEEGFDGILILQKGADSGYVLMDRGKTALTLFSEGWREAPLEEAWQTWVSDLVVRASVEEKSWRPLMTSFRSLLRDLPVTVEDAPTTDQGASPAKRLARTGLFFRRSPSVFATGSGPRRRLVPRLAPGRSLPLAAARHQADEALAQDVAYRFLSWALNELPRILDERGKTESLKYVAQWLPLVSNAMLHHDLPRPNERASDFFDITTADAAGKVLHLAHRAARGTAAAFQEFVERVKTAKTARIKRGDVGGAFFISPHFDEETLEAYRRVATTHEDAGGWRFGAIEAVTAYEAFVRMGPRRGFHLLLVAERPDGFELIG